MIVNFFIWNSTPILLKHTGSPRLATPANYLQNNFNKGFVNPEKWLALTETWKNTGGYNDRNVWNVMTQPWGR